MGVWALALRPSMHISRALDRHPEGQNRIHSPFVRRGWIPNKHQPTSFSTQSFHPTCRPPGLPGL